MRFAIKNLVREVSLPFFKEYVMSRLLAQIAIAIVFSCAVVPSRAQESSDSNYEHLKGLEWLIGQWEADYVLPDGIAELGASEAKVHSRVSYQWLQNKNYIDFTGTDVDDTGREVITSRETTAWDAISGKLVHTLFGSTGFHGTGEWTGSGDTWHLKWSVQGPNKSTYEGTSIHKRIDENNLSWQMVTLTHNGKQIPDWPAVIYKRVDLTTTLPAEAGRQLSYFLGTWQYEWTEEGKPYKGTWGVRWSPDRTCLLSHWSNDGPDGPTRGTNVLGWDSEKGELVEMSFSSDGAHALARYQIKTPNLNEGSLSGVGPGGKPMKSNLRTAKRRDSFTWTLSGQELGGEKQPDLEFTFRRVMSQ